MQGKEVPLSAATAAETANVRSDTTSYNVVMILTLITFLAYVFGADAWRQLFAPTEIWTLWTPYWLWVGIFLIFTHLIFLDFLMIRIRGHMSTFLWVIGVVMFVLLLVGGAIFWGVVLGIYCYGNNASFCWNGTGVPWNTWWAFAAYWACVLLLLIQTIIVTNALRHERLRQRTLPKTIIVENPADEIESQYSPYLFTNPLASAMLLERQKTQ
jgi:hypothetical protein